MSARCSTNSLIAILNAPKELAQAASTTQFIPPKSRRFAIRPEITFANIPGKAFSSHCTYPLLSFSIIFWVSSSDKPLFLRTFSQIGDCNLAPKGTANCLPIATPNTTPVRS